MFRIATPRPLLMALLVSLGALGSACADDPGSQAGPAGTTASSTVATTLPSDGGTSELDGVFEALDANGFNGVVMIDDAGETTTRAFGAADREADIAVDADTVFDVGSITKQFTGAAILHLEMDGALSVEDPLGDHVGGLPADKAALTLHQLLTHTAGLPGEVGPDEEVVSLKDYIDRVAQTPLLHEPGTEYEYSNVGYSLLAAVIENVSDESYEAYLHDALFLPAGMLDTGYVIPDWDDSEIAVGYDSQSKDVYGRPTDIAWDIDGPYWNLRGNGGLLSTAADMLAWDRALRGDDILDIAAKAKLYTRHVSEGPGAPSFYGYGWVVMETPGGSDLITHNGGNGIFFADYLRFLDDEVTIFVATNSVDETNESVAWNLAEIALGQDLGLALDRSVDEAADRCGFNDLSVDALPEATEMATLPESPPGQAAALLLSLLADGDETQLAQFVADHVTTELASDSPEAVAAAMVGLQNEFDGLTPSTVLVEDERTFHVVMSGTPPDALISMGFDQADPERLGCIAVAS